MIMLKKHFKTFGYFCLFGCLAISALSSNAQANQTLLQNIMSQKSNTPLLVSNQTAKLIPKVINENNKSLNYKIDIRYPQIVGDKLTTAARHFNQGILDLINKQITAFKNQVASTANNKALPQATSYLNINYENTGAVSHSQQTEYQSIRFGIETYVRGDAHPANQLLSFNYDLGHDKLLNLTDLFKPNSNYLSVISNYCQRQLLARKLPADFIKTGTAAKPENYPVWSINLESNLVITFNEGQVAARVYGPQEIVIPKELINNLVTLPTACTLSMINCDGT